MIPHRRKESQVVWYNVTKEQSAAVLGAETAGTTITKKQISSPGKSVVCQLRERGGATYPRKKSSNQEEGGEAARKKFFRNQTIKKTGLNQPRFRLLIIYCFDCFVFLKHYLSLFPQCFTLLTREDMSIQRLRLSALPLEYLKEKLIGSYLADIIKQIFRGWGGRCTSTPCLL